MIDILILTHNRPHLFKRCISSLINTIPDHIRAEVKIYVNNDSNDIEEILTDLYIEYSYIKSDDLSIIYKYLFDKSSSEYVWYLEDDDFSLDFWGDIDFEKDLNFLNFKLANTLEAIEERKKEFVLPKVNSIFQLSQLFFKRSTVTKFPTGNALDNDYKLYLEITQNMKSSKLIKKYCWVQTKDGKDNISDASLNKDLRWKICL